MLEYLKSKSYSDNTIRDVSDVFEKLALPLPEEGEFFKTEDLGVLILLSRFACTLRFTPSNVPDIEHPFIIQPLITFQGDILRGQVFPGVKTPFITKDYSQWFKIYEHMEKLLYRDGIQVNDINSHNGGLLPTEDQTQYVFIDPGALKRLNHSTKLVASQTNKNALPDSQTRLYGPIKEKFNDAIASSSIKKIKQTWLECEKLKKSGLLIANWDNVDYSGTTSCAQKYNKKLSRITL
jgi:hypothetical protein